MSGAAVVRLAAWRAAGLGGLPWRDTPPAPAWRHLLQAADRFDALDAPLQQRLRRVLLRHRRLHGRSAGDAAGPARAG